MHRMYLPQKMYITERIPWFRVRRFIRFANEPRAKGHRVCLSRISFGELPETGM